MEQTMAREGTRSDIFQKYLPYLGQQVGYQRLRAKFDSEISWGCTQIHPNGNVFFGISSLGATYQYVVKIE
jgi:hypothetical protein